MNIPFSVLIAVYAKENPDHFRKALESIYYQTKLPTEVVLVKDGPLTLELNTIISEYEKEHSNFRVLTLSQNSGLGNALKLGLNQCSFDWVFRMDSDDISFKDRFEKQLAYIKDHPDVVVCGGHIYEFIEDPAVLYKIKRVPLSYKEVKKFSMLRNPVNHPTVLLKKNAVLSVGSYKDMPLFEDYYLWLRLLKAGYKVENIDEGLLYFRIGEMQRRRHGRGYFKKEISFFKTLKEEQIISKSNFLILIITRLPFRILPQPILSFLYKFLLRENTIFNKVIFTPKGSS